MNHPTVGVLIGTHAQRDAIHVAIAPVVANEQLMPGLPIRFCGQKTQFVEQCTRAESLGIVDPFLIRPVEKGQRCWMFLHPQSITSLRHDWTHPAFDNEAQGKAASERWLREFCAGHEGLDYNDMIEQLQIDGGYTVQHGHESARAEGISEEFRHHFRIVTGSEVLGVFSCSC